MDRTPRRRDDESGAALVEFGLVLVPLLILVVGALIFSLTLGLQQSTTHAASAAAREAVVAPGNDPAAIQTRVNQVVGQQLSWLPAANPTSPATIVDGRVTVTVTVDNPFSALGIFGLRPPAQLTSEAVLQLENV